MSAFPRPERRLERREINGSAVSYRSAGSKVALRFSDSLTLQTMGHGIRMRRRLENANAVGARCGEAVAVRIWDDYGILGWTRGHARLSRNHKITSTRVRPFARSLSHRTKFGPFDHNTLGTSYPSCLDVV